MKRFLTRRKFLIGLGAVAAMPAAGYGWMRYVEPGWFRVREHAVPLRGLKQSVRAVHLSDFHASESVPYHAIEKAIDLAVAEQPDAGFLTGDFISWKIHEPKTFERILKKLTDSVPCYACIGNHDGGSWAAGHGYASPRAVSELLERSGVRVLFNEKTQVEIAGNGMSIAGLGDWWSKDCKPEGLLEREATHDRPLIVLSHNPDSIQVLRDYAWDLMLCGHTHGGQLVIPLTGSRPFLPVENKELNEGLVEVDGRTLHITRGIGNLHGMRLNCRPEVSVLNLLSNNR